MNRKKRLFTMAALAAVVGALVVGCGSDSESSGTSGSANSDPKSIMTFIYAPENFNDATKAWGNGFKRAQEELESRADVTMKFEGKLDLDPASYLNFIRSAMIEEPDGIVVDPNNSEGIQEGLQKIVEQTGVELVVMDQPVEGVDEVSFVGTNNVEAGNKAGEYMVQLLDEGELGSNEIAVLRQPPGNSSTDDRLAGFLEAIKESPLEVVATAQPEGGDLAAARAALADMFTANPDIGGVFAVTDLLALGSAEAIKAGHSDVEQVSIDATQEGVKLIIEEGGIKAEVAQHLEEMAYTAVMTLAKALEGKSVPANIDTGTTLVTADNAEEYLKQAEKEAR